MGINFQKMEMQTQEAEHLRWLHGMLLDSKRRGQLRRLLEQYELPVIQIKRRIRVLKPHKGRLSPPKHRQASRKVPR